MSTARRYRVFDQVLESWCEQPGLPVAPADARATLRAELGISRSLDSMDWRSVLEWRDDPGSVIASVRRHGGSWMLDFPGQARFILAADGVIRCEPKASCSPELLRHLLVDQAIPRHLCQHGRVVLHASAVRLPGGQGVVFLGPSGAGKSTLAAGLVDAGCTVLADDSVLLDRRGSEAALCGAYPGLRLRPAAEGTGLRQGGEGWQESRVSGKRQLTPPGSFPADRVGWTPLTAIFLLGRAARPEVVPVTGVQAWEACQRSLFTLDPSASGLAERHFRGLGAVLDAGAPIYHLRYPFDPAMFADVQALMLAAVAGVRETQTDDATVMLKQPGAR